MKKILFFIVLAIANIAVHAMESNIVTALKQEDQAETIYCSTCSTVRQDSCLNCLRFITNDRKKFRIAKDLVPVQWQQSKNMLAKQENNYVPLPDFSSKDLALFTGSVLAQNKDNICAKLGLSTEEIQEELDANLLSLQDAQELINLMEKGLLWGLERKALSAIAEPLALLIKEDQSFDLIEFAKNPDISPEIVSAVVSWLTIFNKDLKIPVSSDGKTPVKTNISFKDWSKYNDATKKIIQGSILNLSDIGLSDIEGLADFLEKHGSKIISIDLSNNYISALQPGVFCNYPQLRQVNLGGNQISILQPGVFSNCPQLRIVDLSCNQIRALQPGIFSNCPKLKEISLINNQISGLQPGIFSNCPKLNTVWLYNNQIRVLQPGVFGNCPQLNVVWLSYNQINELQPGIFSNCPQLKEVHLGDNKISALQPEVFSNCPLITNNWEAFKAVVLYSQNKQY